MTDHTIEVHFKATASCTSIDVNRDAKIIRKMAEAVADPANPYFPLALIEAEKVYRMMVAMRLALEEECKALESIKQVD